MLSHPQKEIFTKVSNLEEELKTNPGFIVMKFGAEWCGPCKKIEEQVNILMQKTGSNVKCYIIDIDEEDNFETYAFLKTKKMVNGIPAILCWKKGNVSHIPDDVVVGSNAVEINLFFERNFF